MPSFLQRLGTALRLIEPGSQESQNGMPQRVIIHTEPTGSSGTEIYSGYYSEEYLNQLRGPQAADVWDQVRRSDAKIRMCLKAVKAPILGAQWGVRSAGQEDKQKFQADLVEQILFHDLPQSFTQQLQEILTFLDFGFSVFEVIHGIQVGHNKFGNYNTIKKIAWRSARTIERWNLDKQTGQLKSVSQYAYGDLQKLVDIPSEFLVVFTNEKEGDNYEGISALRACYGPWKRKNTYQKLMAIGIEKYAVPTPIMEVPTGKENTTEYNNAKLMMEKYVSHEKNYFMVAQGWKLSFGNPSNFDASKIQDAIVRENAEIASAFLVSFLELGQQQSGSWALSNDLSDFALLSIQYVADYICEILNGTIIKQIVDMNFGPQESYPELFCAGIKDKPGKEFAEILKLLVDGKVITPDLELEDEMREKYGLPDKEEIAAQTDPSTGIAVNPTDIQKSALNGSQIDSLVNVIQQVSSGLITRESGLSIIQIAFQVSIEEAERLLPAQMPKTPQVPAAQPSQKVGLSEPKVIQADSDERGLWQTAGDETVCPYCDELDGEITSKEPPLHDNCRCSKDYEIKTTEAVKSHKLQEGTDFTLLQIDVSKKIASTQSEAERLAQEISSLGQTVKRSENEFEYRFTLIDPSLLVEGSLKSFEPLEGVKVMYGKRIVDSKPSTINP